MTFEEYRREFARHTAIASVDYRSCGVFHKDDKLNEVFEEILAFPQFLDDDYGDWREYSQEQIATLRADFEDGFTFFRDAPRGDEEFGKRFDALWPEYPNRYITPVNCRLDPPSGNRPLGIAA